MSKIRANGGFAYPKSQRLLKRSEFLALSDRVTGKYDFKISGEAMLLLARANNFQCNRLGVTVSKKVGNAVRRNSIKRLVREYFRLNNRQWPQGFDYLFIARRSAGTFACARIRRELGSNIEPKLQKKNQQFSVKHLAREPEPTSSEMCAVDKRPNGSANDCLKDELNFFFGAMGRLLSGVALLLIRFYQKFISPLFPPSCRFIPTCSAYGVKAISTHGFWRGSYLTARRLLKCHPFHPGGYDPVPPMKNQKHEG